MLVTDLDERIAIVWKAPDSVFHSSWEHSDLSPKQIQLKIPNNNKH